MATASPEAQRGLEEPELEVESNFKVADLNVRDE